MVYMQLTTSPIKVLSPAKLNLGLWLLDKRPDGYHEIFTIYHTINLFDEISIEEGKLSIETSNCIPQEENLVYKAIRLLEKELGKELRFRIYIDKKIPVGGGLGGGSSNVATVLKTINSMLGNPLSFDKLLEIARNVSSDAPFFLYGGTAIGRGRGDIIEPIDPINLKFTVICPGVQAFSKRVYSMVSKKELTKDLDTDKILACLYRGKFEVLENRLGGLSAKAFPEVEEVIKFFSELGYRPIVSGSGSCVYIIECASEEVKRGASLRGWSLYEVESWYGV